jgi:hypothetical protein
MIPTAITWAADNLTEDLDIIDVVPAGSPVGNALMALQFRGLQGLPDLDETVTVDGLKAIGRAARRQVRRESLCARVGHVPAEVGTRCLCGAKHYVKLTGESA